MRARPIWIRVLKDPADRLVGYRGGLDEYLPENLAAEKTSGSGIELVGRAVQVDSINTRVESANGFSACSYNMMKRFQTLLSFQVALLLVGREPFSPRNMATLCCLHSNVGGFHRAMVKAGRCTTKAVQPNTAPPSMVTTPNTTPHTLVTSPNTTTPSMVTVPNSTPPSMVTSPNSTPPR